MKKSVQPITDLRDNLAWTRHGVVWATWRVDGLPYGHRPLKHKTAVKDLHRMLVRAMSGEALILSVTINVEPNTVVTRMIEGHDLDECPLLVDEANATLDSLEELPLGERVYYLSVPLPNDGAKAWTAPARSAQARLQDALALPRTPLTDQEHRRRGEQAVAVAEAIPPGFEITPVTPAEHLWLAAHAARRGWIDGDLPPALVTGDEQSSTTISGAGSVLDPVLDMGAYSDLDKPAAARANPLKRKILKVVDSSLPSDEQQASYQGLMVLSSPPSGGVEFPGSELLAKLDTWGPEVDWAIRLRVVSRDKAMKANRKAVRDLRDQYDQRDSDAGEDMGSHDLDLAAELLGEYQALLAQDRLEVEVEHTIILAVGAPTFAEANEQSDSLQRHLASYDFKFERLTGGSIELWDAMHIGVPTSRLVRSYAQISTSAQFAMMVPFTSSRLGGSCGQVAALNTSTARTSVIHQNPAGYPALRKSGSVVWVGELGSGKSYGMKSAAAFVVAVRGQLFAIDKSNEGEWADFATALIPAEQVQVVDCAAPSWSMDPLRIIPDWSEATDAAKRFFGTLLNVSAVDGDEPALALSRLLSPSYLDEHGLTSSQQVLEHLSSCDLPGADSLRVRMAAQAESQFGALVFDDSLPPVRGDLSAVVWRTHRMRQPTDDELANAHLFRGLPAEVVFTRAYYGLMVATARRWIFTDRSRFSVLVVDEAYDTNRNPETAREIETVVREGRRANGAVFAGSHNPDADFGTDTMRKLMPTRYVMRHTDVDLAKASIRFLGVPESDPSFEAMVDALISDTSPEIPDKGVVPGREGECFMRDAYGGIGPAKLLGPAQPHVRAALESSPPSRTREQVTL